MAILALALSVAFTLSHPPNLPQDFAGNDVLNVVRRVLSKCYYLPF